MATPRKDPLRPLRKLDDIRSYKYRDILTEEWLAPRWLGGMQPWEIAQEAGCSVSTIRLHARRLGLPGRPRRDRAGSRGWEDVLTRPFLEAAYVEGGMTVEAIACEAGCPPQAVQRALEREGIPRRGHQPGVDNLLYADTLTADFLTDRLDARMSIPQIAAEVGCSDVAIRNAVRRFGLSHLTPSVRAPQPACAPESELRRLFESGMALEAIAARLGVSRTKVRSDLSRFGIRPYARPGHRLTDGAWTGDGPAHGSLEEKAPPSRQGAPRRYPQLRAPQGAPAPEAPVVPEKLTLAEQRVVRALTATPVVDPGGRAVKQLREALGMSRSDLATALSRLLAMGLLRREGGQHRPSLLALTEAGAALATQLPRHPPMVDEERVEVLRALLANGPLRSPDGLAVAALAGSLSADRPTPLWSLLCGMARDRLLTMRIDGRRAFEIAVAALDEETLAHVHDLAEYPIKPVTAGRARQPGYLRPRARAAAPNA